jgi:hypothetical protein
MQRLDQFRSCDRKKMMTSTGILGATKDDYLTHVPNTTGQDPYVLKSLNPDFVRVAKA